MRPTLATKVSGIVILIIGLTLGLTTMLNYFKFEQTFRQVTESRLSFIAGRLRDRIQTGLDLGLSLGSMSNVQAIIDTELAGDTQILSIEVFDDRGTILFRTGQSPSDDALPASWRVGLDPESGMTWRADDPDAIVVGSGLINNFGVQVGSVALRYSRALQDTILAGMATHLTRFGLVILVLAVALAWAATLLLVRGANSSFRRIRSALQAELTEPDARPFVARNNRIEREFADMDQQLRTALGELSAAEERLRQLRPTE